MAIKGYNLTEKTTQQAEDNKYVFWVDKKDTKPKIKSEVEERFDVTVLDVNTLNLKGKEKTWQRDTGKRADRKKAIVTLKEGDKIKDVEINT